jgi:DNA-binding transcriptional MerR regulator
MSRKTTTAVALTGAVAAISGAYALGTQVRDGSAQARDAASTSTTTGGSPTTALTAGGRPDPGQELAQRLGVSQDALRKALDALRAKGTSPGAGGPARDHAAADAALADALGVTPARLRAALQKLHDAHEQQELSALAKALGVDVAELQSALDALRPQGARGAPPAGAPPAGGPRRDHRGPDGLAAALAKKLGLGTAAVRRALQSVHPDRGARDRADRKDDLVAGLAKELGLDPAEVKAALAKLRTTEQQRWQARRTAFADALAKQLGIDAKKVRDALAAGPGPGFGPGGGPGFGHGHGHGPGGRGPGGP